MQDRALYAEILGIKAPWFVEQVELKLAEGEVHVHLDECDVESWPCPESGESCRPYDHQAERQ
jgi:transposase